MRARVLGQVRVPKALACGILEDGGRVLFLLRRGPDGLERLTLPCTLVPSGRSPFADMKIEFERQTGIECQVHEIISEGRHNAGSRKRKQFVPALAFRITARNMRARPPSEFSGFRWLVMEAALKARLAREMEWLKRMEKGGSGNERKNHKAGP